MSDQSHSAGETGPSQRGVEIAVALATLAFGIIILIGSLQVGIDWGFEGPKSGFFPFYVSLFIIVASLYNLLQATTLGGIKPGLFASVDQLKRVLSVVVPATIYVALVPFIGMYVSSILLIAVFMMWLGKYSLLHTLPIALGVPAVVYVVFERYFQIALPKGPIEYWLGL
ncbi:MAG: tripartite tricarboxylate transporter TctB family protein [Xanthobacteraceae bacterium]|nr:tripartite tricarboxylate transporter TctB family protein [Xanthobacteraceae bacterium]